MNLACGIEYDGTNYHGFQRLASDQGPSIQGALEEAIARVSREQVVVNGAGRTDAGVHASGQVIHFHSLAHHSPEVWTRALNAVLPADIAVRWTKAVPERFHSRFSAASRSYRYTILNEPIRKPLLARYSYYRKHPLDVDLMNEACLLLLGNKDFGAFGRSPNETNPRKMGPHHCIRTMLEARCIRDDALIYCDFTANAFLKGMVRRIVGTLLLVGDKRMSLEEFATIVQQAKRTHPGAAAPPQGLCLVRVDYPDEWGI